MTLLGKYDGVITLPQCFQYIDPQALTCMACFMQASFGHDFKSVDFSDARVIRVLPRGLEECQKRMTNPIQRLLTFTKVGSQQVVPSHGSCIDMAWHVTSMKIG